jgi:predicted AAA+ superfamily ATPase
LIREFIKANYRNSVEFNLVDNIKVRDSFRAASDASDLLLRLSVAAESPLIPGETVVFIDEVQVAPEIVTYIKFLVDKGDFDYILSGSMLGVELEDIRSYPTGYLHELKMFPLDFEEFCIALGLQDGASDAAKQAFEAGTPIPDFIHDRLMSLFHKYLVIGGMPDAVVAFLESGSIDQVRNAQHDILAFYKRDISKYAPKEDRLVIRNIFDLIPSELLSQNRRFRLSSIENVKRYSQVQNQFLWLTKAAVAIAAYNVRTPASPLLLSENHSLFKLFMSDVGLLCGRLTKQTMLGLLDGKPGSNMGGIYENYVSEELCSKGFDLRYFTNRKVGELDFVIENGDGEVIAIEVKSGSNYKAHSALTNALAVKNYGIDKAYVLAETNIEQDGDVKYIPIYMTSKINSITGTKMSARAIRNPAFDTDV